MFAPHARREPPQRDASGRVRAHRHSGFTLAVSGSRAEDCLVVSRSYRNTTATVMRRSPVFRPVSTSSRNMSQNPAPSPRYSGSGRRKTTRARRPGGPRITTWCPWPAVLGCPQSRPQPGLRAQSRHRSVRSRRGRRGPAGHRSADRGDETGRAVMAEFSAPSAGPPPCFVYRLSLHSGTALQTIAPAGDPLAVLKPAARRGNGRAARLTAQASLRHAMTAARWFCPCWKPTRRVTPTHPPGNSSPPHAPQSHSAGGRVVRRRQPISCHQEVPVVAAVGRHRRRASARRPGAGRTAARRRARRPP